jgi:hypothetical protein
LWAGLWATRGNITVSGISNFLNYCVIFIVFTQFTNVSAGRIIQPGGPRVEDPWSSSGVFNRYLLKGYILTAG